MGWRGTEKARKSRSLVQERRTGVSRAKLQKNIESEHGEGPNAGYDGGRRGTKKTLHRFLRRIGSIGREKSAAEHAPGKGGNK